MIQFDEYFSEGLRLQVPTRKWFRVDLGIFTRPPPKKKKTSRMRYTVFFVNWAPVRCWDVATFETLPCVLSFENFLFLCWCEGGHHQKGWILWRQLSFVCGRCLLKFSLAWIVDSQVIAVDAADISGRYQKKNTQKKYDLHQICEYFSSKKIAGSCIKIGVSQHPPLLRWPFCLPLRLDVIPRIPPDGDHLSIIKPRLVVSLWTCD